MRTILASVILAACMMMGSGGVAHAIPVVLNPDFGPANSGVGYGPVPYWVANGNDYGSNGEPVGSQPFWNNGVAPNGATTVGFIQAGSFSQTISGFIVGTMYDLAFWANARANDQTGGLVNTGDGYPWLLQDSMNGVMLSQRTVYSGGFIKYVDNFIANNTSETLLFGGGAIGGDGSVLLTEVSVTMSNIPEPSSLSIDIYGIILLILFMKSLKSRYIKH